MRQRQRIGDRLIGERQYFKDIGLIQAVSGRQNFGTGPVENVSHATYRTGLV
jgi:hypothetical protein